MATRNTTKGTETMTKRLTKTMRSVLEVAKSIAKENGVCTYGDLRERGHAARTIWALVERGELGLPKHGVVLRARQEAG